MSPEQREWLEGMSEVYGSAREGEVCRAALSEIDALRALLTEARKVLTEATTDDCDDGHCNHVDCVRVAYRSSVDFLAKLNALEGKS